MKKHLLFTFAFMFSLGLSAQIGILDEDNNYVHETVVDIFMSSDDEHIETDFKTENQSDETKSYNLKRYELEYIDGSQEYFCWTLCLNPADAGTNPTWVFPSGAGLLELDAGAEGNLSAPAFHFRPEGNTGTATYRYVVYDYNDENDSTWIDVTYHVGAVGVEEYSANAVSDVYPSPANDFIFVDITSELTNPQFEIYSMVGNRITPSEVRVDNTKVRIDVSSLSPGIYMLMETQSQLTRKFIISK